MVGDLRDRGRPRGHRVPHADVEALVHADGGHRPRRQHDHVARHRDEAKPELCPAGGDGHLREDIGLAMRP